MLSLEGYQDPTTIPVTQDASSSAYQIMSDFLLDVDLAKLIPSDGKIKDIDSYLLEELKQFLQDQVDPTIYQIVCSHLTRQLVKAILMPGQTVISMARDIHDALTFLLTRQECYRPSAFSYGARDILTWQT